LQEKNKKLTANQGAYGMCRCSSSQQKPSTTNGEFPQKKGQAIRFTPHPKKSGFIASLRLEKTCKIIKSNHQPNTTMPAKPCAEVPRLYFF